jgi:hypothetical protein
MATFVNDLRLKEITTGDEDGTWGTSTNTNLALIADAFSLGTKDMAGDANETFTMPDAVADGVRSLYLKITSAVSLTATRTVTLAPNTVSKVWIIENATSGAQSITISQGSGGTVTIATGQKVMVVTDGAGAGAAVVNANPITDLASQVTGTLPVANGGTGVTSSTGTGNVVLSNSPTLVTPALGTPASGTLTNATGLPIVAGTTGTLSVARGGTGITSFGTGVATWLGTPSSANLAAAVTDETGTGALVFANSPTLVTPALGTPASGVVTNLTGTASININGTVGATTPATGAFTTLAASTSLSTPLVTNAGTLAFSATGANIVTASTNGVERLRIDSAGNVLVGISSSQSGSKMVVNGNIALQAVVGSPGDAFSTLQFFNNNSTGFLNAGISATVGSTVNSGNILFNTNNAGTYAERMRINQQGNVGIGLTSPNVSLEVAGNIHVSGADRSIFNRSNNALTFGTNNTERVRITSAGLVGIGTSSPSYKLHVVGASEQTNPEADAGLYTLFHNSSSTLNTCSAIGFGTNSNIGVALVAQRVGANNEHVLKIQNRNSAGNLGTRVTLDGSGNVGIATTSPAVKLDIVGRARASTGILFGTDTADANALDDYEEGTWTPNTTSGGTLSSVQGFYTKVGNTVTAWYTFTVNSTTSSIIRLIGFPFAAGATGFRGVVVFSTANADANGPYQWSSTPDLTNSNGTTLPSHNTVNGDSFAGFFVYQV